MSQVSFINHRKSLNDYINQLQEKFLLLVQLIKIKDSLAPVTQYLKLTYILFIN